MADFNTWKFESLVQFAHDAQTKIKDLEALVLSDTAEFQARIDALELALAECGKDRRHLLDELRKTIVENNKQ